MRHLVCATALFAAPVAAQPVAQESVEAKPCAVTIARAPEEVRPVLEAWVRTEPQCSVSLEVRIVATDGGYYLLAQDERGRIRERVVPDAQSAGVLVASWIADDNAPAPQVIAPASAAEIAPVPWPAPTATTPQPRSPALTVTISPKEMLTPPGLAPMALTETAPPAAPRRRWLTAGLLLPLTESSGIGLRIEADVIKRGRWLFGAAGSLAESYMRLQSAYTNYAYIYARDMRAVAYVARPWYRGRWELRPMVGLGFMHSAGAVFDGSMTFDVEGAFVTLEAGFLIDRDLGKSWALYAGPLATVMMQKYDSDGVTPMVIRNNLDFVMFAGVRRRL